MNALDVDFLSSVCIFRKRSSNFYITKISHFTPIFTCEANNFNSFFAGHLHGIEHIF